MHFMLICMYFKKLRKGKDLRIIHKKFIRAVMGGSGVYNI